MPSERPRHTLATRGRRFALVVRSRPALLLAGLALGVAMAALLVWLDPVSYTATATFDGRAATSPSSDRWDLAEARNASSRAPELAQDLRVMQRVVESLKLAEDPVGINALKLGGVDPGLRPALAAQRLASRVAVDAVREGALVSFSVTLSNPWLAARAANAIVQAVGDVDAELRAASMARNVERAAGQLAQLRARLERTQARLAAQERGLDPGFDTAQAMANLSQIAGLTRAITNGPLGRDEVGVADGMQPASFEALVAASARPIAATVTGLAGGETERRLVKESSRETLQQEIALAKQSLDLVQGKLAMLNAETAVAASWVNLSTPAAPPSLPSSLPIWFRLLLGVIGGAAAGVVLVGVVEHFDRRVRVPVDLAAELGIAVFGTLRGPGPRASRTGRSSAIAARRGPVQVSGGAA